MGLEPTLPPCKGGVLPLNYGPVKNQEPPARCRRPPGRGTSESLPEILRPPALCRRPRPRWQPFCLASAQTKPSRPQSRQRPVVISKMENTTPRGRGRSEGTIRESRIVRLCEAVQGQDIDGPANLSLAAVEVEQGGVVSGPAAGNVLRLVDGAEFFVQGFDTFVDGFAGGHGVSLFLKCCFKFQPSFPPPIAARRCEI